MNHKIAFAPFLIFCSIANVTVGDDWPNWLGPYGDGTWREDGIIDAVPGEGLKTVWRAEINGGYSGAVVSDGKLYVMDFVKGEEPERTTDGAPVVSKGPSGLERILCLNSESGEKLWEHSYTTTLDVSYPGGPRTSPVLDDGRLYCLGTMGQLLCLDPASGKVHWEMNLAKEFDAKPPIWGYAANPLIVGEQLICLAGGEGSGVVALNKKSGALNWKNITAQEIGYAPPVIAELNGKTQLVAWYDVAVAGLDLLTGQLLWEHKFPSAQPMRPVVSIVPPHVSGNKIFLSNFYHGSARIEITESGARELWNTEKSKGHRDDINSIMSTIILDDACYFGVAGNGELRCVDAESGKLVWQSYKALATSEEDPDVLPRGFKGFASMFLVPHQGKYWLFTDQGELILADLTREGYFEQGRAKLLDTTGSTRGRAYVWCPPAFSDGKIFVRNEKEIICVDLRASSY